MTKACKADLSFAALVLLMQSHQLATQGICGWNLTACVEGTASRHCPVNAQLGSGLAAESHDCAMLLQARKTTLQHIP